MLVKRLKNNEWYYVIIDKVMEKGIIYIGTDWRTEYFGSYNGYLPAEELIHKGKSIVEARKVLKEKCKTFSKKDIELEAEEEREEIYNIHALDDLFFKKAAVIGYTYRNKNTRLCYVALDTGKKLELPLDIVKHYIKTNQAEFVGIELKNDRLKLVKADYSKCRDWLDTDACHKEMWFYLNKMAKFTDKQKNYIINYIMTNNYGIDTEDLISLMTCPKEWFPSKFRALDTQCRDRAFELMEKFKIIKE